MGPPDPPPPHCSLSQTPEQGQAPDKQPLPLRVQRGVFAELLEVSGSLREKPGWNGGRVPGRGVGAGVSKIDDLVCRSGAAKETSGTGFPTSPCHAPGRTFVELGPSCPTASPLKSVTRL